MIIRSALLIVLIAAIAALSIVFARPLLGLPPASPSPTRPGPSPTVAASSPTVGVVVTPATTALPRPTPTPTRTPTTTCPPVPAGGRTGGFHSLVDVRVGRQPGFDRVVFDFGQEKNAQDDVPAFHIERASSFTAISGQPVPVQGTVFWSVRIEGASIADQSGNLVYTGPRDLDPTTALVRDVKQVEDFEAQMIWAIGLAQLECPRVTVLRSPLRLVIDLPNPRDRDLR